MKFLIPVFVLTAAALTGTSCNTLDQTNTNFSNTNRRMATRGYYSSPRFDPAGAPGLWDVKQNGGGTSIAYRN